MKLYLDTETFNELPIKNGTYVYTESCETMLLTYAVDDGEVECVDFTMKGWEPGLQKFKDIIENAPLVDDEFITIAHSSMFDRNVLKYSLGVHIPIRYWYDTMVQALAHGLPGGLDKLCEILRIGAEDAKHKEGRQLIQLFCKPRPKNSKLRRATHVTNPKEWSEFVEYAKADIRAMREAHKKLPTWNYPLPTGGEVRGELALWHLDQEINDRGMLIDANLVRGALRAVDAEQGRLASQTSVATSGVVESATKRDKLLAHILEHYGVELPNMQKDTLERRITDPDLPEAVKELLRIRLQSTTTSTSKYKALERGTSPDGRLRGTLQFDGAARTRRAAGRTFQPQNLPSRGLIDAALVEFAIRALIEGHEDLIFDNIMLTTSSCIRGAIIAPRGKKLCVADLANIEGRDQAWLAGEEWKLQAFRDFDNGEGPDMYRLAYAKAFAMDPDDVDGGSSKGPQRQIGKVMELMLGYEGGVGAYVTGAETYGIDLDEMAEAARPHIPDEIWDESKKLLKFFDDKGIDTYGLDRNTWLVCDSLKRLWRYAHPAISSYWRELKDAAIEATLNPGVTITCRRLKVRRTGEWLRLVMPSGRALCYPQPRVNDKGELSYMGVNTYTKKWSRIKTYGGKLFENACQSLARDILYDAMPACEAAGYEIILTVHDEVVTEAPDTDEFDHHKLSAILATNPEWAADMPLAAAGFSAQRYKKD